MSCHTRFVTTSVRHGGIAQALENQEAGVIIAASHHFSDAKGWTMFLSLMYDPERKQNAVN